MRTVFMAAIAASVLAASSPALAEASFEQTPAGVASTTRTPWDPAEKANRISFSIHETLDRYLFRPAALAYSAVVPKLVRVGLEHVLSNLGEPVVVVNDLLQGRFSKGGEATGRFLVNSTLGVGGLFDVGAKGGLPHHDNGFALTLGRAGVGPGPYLFIPFIGPTTVRDLFGQGVDIVTNPFHWLVHHESDAIIAGTAVAAGLDMRANADADLTALMSNATDPYATLRSVYLQNDESEINDAPAGAVPALPNFDDSPMPPAAAPPSPSPSTGTPTVPPTAAPQAALSIPPAPKAAALAPVAAAASPFAPDPSSVPAPSSSPDTQLVVATWRFPPRGATAVS